MEHAPANGLDAGALKGRKSPIDAHGVLFDSGLKAWLQVLGSFCVFFNAWGLVNAYGVFQTLYQSSLFASYSPSQISWIGSIQIFWIFFGALLAGPVFDRGYLRALIQAGSFLVVFGMMMLSLCTEYWQVFLAQGLTVGLGVGCLFLPAIATVMHYFKKKKALATGIVASGSSLGGVVYPIIFERLEARLGFPWATRIVAFVNLAVFIPPLIVMSSRVPTSTAKRALYDKSAFSDAAYMLFCLGQFFGFTAIYITFYYIQLYAIQQTDTSLLLASYSIPIISAASTFGRLVPNALADRLGSLNLLIPLTFSTAILTFCWIAIHNSAGLVVFSVLYGFFQGPFVSLPPTIVATLTPELGKIGVRLGMMLAISGIGSLVGEPIAGAILNRPNGWLGLQVWCAALFVVSGMCSMGTKLLKLREARRKVDSGEGVSEDQTAAPE